MLAFTFNNAKIPQFGIRKPRLEDVISITPYIRSEAEDVRGGQTLTKTASGRRYLESTSSW